MLSVFSCQWGELFIHRHKPFDMVAAFSHLVCWRLMCVCGACDQCSPGVPWVLRVSMQSALILMQAQANHTHSLKQLMRANLPFGAVYPPLPSPPGWAGRAHRPLLVSCLVMVPGNGSHPLCLYLPLAVLFCALCSMSPIF